MTAAYDTHTPERMVMQPLLRVPVADWPESSCAKPLTQVHRRTKRRRQLPRHRQRSLGCPVCGPARIAADLQHLTAVLPPEVFVTVLPTAAAASRVTERMSKRADPGPRVVVRRSDTAAVLMVSALSLSKAKGTDPHPSRPVPAADALRLLQTALALPGLAARGSVTMVGGWTRASSPAPPAAQPDPDWLNVHSSVPEARNRLQFLASQVTADPTAPGLQFVEDVTGLHALVVAEDGLWAAVMDALVNDLPDDCFSGWDHVADEPAEAPSSVGSAPLGSNALPTEVCLPTDQCLTNTSNPSAFALDGTQMALHTDPTTDPLPPSKRTVGLDAKVSR